MSTGKLKKFKPGSGKHIAEKRRVEPADEIGVDELRKREKYFEVFVIIALFAFGVYNSILYFGHTVVPVSDFPDLYRVGREILSFKLPTRFMQAPVLGMLQVCLSYIVGGPDPINLKAGWLLNAMLYPFSLVLLWLVARQIVGKSGLWLAVVALINPWVIYLLTEPIVETALLFFTLLTFYFMFRRSMWCYLFASVTTMVRYEGAALILAAFVMDMIDAGDKRQRINAFVYSVFASAPLGLWLLGTFLTWEPDTFHYFNVWGKDYEKGFKEPVADRTGVFLHLRLLWHVGFRPLLASVTDVKTTFGLISPTPAEVQSVQALFTASKVVAVVGGVFGAVYGLARRNWNILALLIFFVPYFILHALYPYPLQRFHTSIFWIALLIFWFGLRGIWDLINANGRAPRPIVLMLQGLVAVIAVVWLVLLLPYLSKISSISPTSVWLPYAAIALLVVIAAVRIYIYRLRHVLRELSILSLVSLMIVSNQFRLAPLVNDGQKEAEFKLLVKWYVANAKPGEKMAVYMAGVVKMFAPERAEYIVQPPKADSPSEFVQACYDQDIAYVVWATREGMGQDHAGYKLLGLDKNMAALREPRDVGPYKYVTQVGAKRGYVNIFRLERPAVPKPGS